jgi:hypothetical protein
MRSARRDSASTSPSPASPIYVTDYTRGRAHPVAQARNGTIDSTGRLMLVGNIPRD